jgi:hypothetical protein
VASSGSILESIQVLADHADMTLSPFNPQQLLGY